MSITIAEIQATVARHYGMDADDLKSARQSLEYARPRQVAIYLSRRLTPRSLKQIASKFGNRDHSTVHYAIKRIETLRIEDEDMDFAVAELSRRITAQHQHRLNDELIGWMA